jgi:Protein of unknown function (DUF1553)/Protein of unknown function (DUF1549)
MARFSSRESSTRRADDAARRPLGARALRVGARLILPIVAIACLGGDDPRPATPREKPIGAVDREHWAFKRPIRPRLPTVVDSSWTRNLIDAFILATLEESGVRPAPEADRATLLRRLTFDLTGLPPTPNEIDDFVDDQSPNAYERVVDRLLASPQYGIRWGQYWLDLARYADTDGFEFDQARPNAWRYRDWVVDALNQDLRYDVFIQRQIAADETDPDDSSAFVATGFNRCYPDMVDLNDQALRRQNALNDVTETAGLVFLGLTIGCARCHDHKFDALRQSDFYRLQAFFTPARFRDDYPLGTPEARVAHEQKTRAWEAELARVQSELIRLEAPAREKLAPGLPPSADELVIRAAQKTADERTPAEVRLVFEALSKDPRVKAPALLAAMEPEAATERAALLDRLAKIRQAAPAPLPLARGLDETGTTAPPTYLLRRGELSAKGAEVVPAFPVVLDENVPAIPPTTHSTGRRAALARWLTRTDHPLTARVLVNRLWQHHFGRGIVATPSDFGTIGEPPTHPELLDWLATELVMRGWSQKAMHRLMVTSATYRQSSTTKKGIAARTPGDDHPDPDNTLLWSFRRRRLDGETIRDALLAVSGQLNPALGGPSVFPELPAELTKLSSKGAIWPVSPGADDRNRRGLYVFIRRNLRYPFFEAFDRPDTNASCPDRPVTTIAPQALSLLNSKIAQDAARALARRILAEAGPDKDARIRHAYRLTLGRAPDQDESRLARDFLTSDDEASWVAFSLALLNVNEFIYMD